MSGMLKYVLLGLVFLIGANVALAVTGNRILLSETLRPAPKPKIIKRKCGAAIPSEFGTYPSSISREDMDCLIATGQFHDVVPPTKDTLDCEYWTGRGIKTVSIPKGDGLTERDQCPIFYRLN